MASRVATPVQAPATFDFYVSATGTGTASGGGSISDPWAWTMINDSTARARYAGKRVGFLDGTYDLYAAANAASFNIPVINIAGGSSLANTVVASVNLRGAWLNAKSGSTYGGTSNENGTCLIGCALDGVSGDYVTIDGFKISGCTGTPIQIGYSGSTNVGNVIQNNEITDCLATGLGSGGNISVITAYQNDGLQILNNYAHDCNGPTAGSTDHFSGILLFNDCINTTVQYNTFTNAGALLYPKVFTQYNFEISYNYCDTSMYSDAANCVQDGLSLLPVISGSYYRIHHNVLIARGAAIAIMQGGTAHECGSEDVQIYSNTLLYAGSSSANDYQGFINCNKYTPGPTIYDNLCYSTVATGVNGTGGIWISEGPATLIDYNMYPTAQARWGMTTNGAGFYPTSAGTTLTGGSFPWNTMTAVAGSIGKEAHSFQSNTANFMNTGTFADLYRLDTGSAALNVGKVGGVIGGANCHIGAWDGTVSRIGFSAAIRM